MRGRIDTVAERQSRKAQARRYRLLVIDDDYQIQQLFCDIFDGSAVTVLCASSSEEANCHLADPAIDLAVIDIVLPGRNGTALAANFEARQIPVLLMSGHPEAIADYAKESRTLLQKPFTVRDLTDAVAERLLCDAGAVM